MTKTSYAKVNLKEIDYLINELIFGLPKNAVNDKDIGNAVFSTLINNEPTFKEGMPSRHTYIWNKNKHSVEFFGTKYNYGGKTGDGGYGLWFWHNRFNQPYQEDIEEHVKNWIRPAPPYSSDISLAMSVADKVALFDTIMLDKIKGENIWFTLLKPIKSLERISMGHSAAEAVARACLVLKVKENEQTRSTDKLSYCGLTETCSSG